MNTVKVYCTSNLLYFIVWCGWQILTVVIIADVTRSEKDVVTLETHPLSQPPSSVSSSQQSILSPPPSATPPLISPSSRARVILGGEVPETQRSNDSDHTIGSGSTDSERTPVRVDSQDSQVSDGETGNEKSAWPRQNSVST